MRWTLCLFVFLWRSMRVKSVCDRLWHSRGLHCYFVSNSTGTYANTFSTCQQFKALPVDIEDYSENSFLVDISPKATDELYWIGYEHVVGNIWRWNATSSTGLFQNWEPGEPDGQGKCSAIAAYGRGRWRDRDCRTKLKFICKKKADCSAPPVMINGLDVRTSVPALLSENHIIFASSTIAFYECEDGYEFADRGFSKSSVCEIGGRWEPNVPSNTPCMPKKCTSPPQYDFTVSNVDPAIEYYTFGSIITYQCSPGYWFHPYEVTTSEKYLKCESDKTWRETNSKANNIPLDKCSKMHCIRPVTANSVSNTSLNVFGTVARYECDYGYKYSDNETVKIFECGRETWSPPAEQCIVGKCPRHFVQNAIATPNSVDFGTTVTWQCLPGHKYADTKVRKEMYCQGNEKWDRIINAGCETTPCLKPPTNASSTYYHNWDPDVTYRYLDNITYTCTYAKEGWTFPAEDPTKEPSSTRSAICGEDAEWVPQYIGECTGDPVVIITSHVVKDPMESPAGQVFGPIGYTVVGLLLLFFVILDLTTIGKSIAMIKGNMSSAARIDEEAAAPDQLDKWNKTEHENKEAGGKKNTKTIIRKQKTKSSATSSRKMRVEKSDADDAFQQLPSTSGKQAASTSHL